MSEDDHLWNDPHFSVASYLDSVPNDSLAQVALQLQLQTQSCHEEIGKIGAELQAIVPRCAADVGRIHVGLENLDANFQLDDDNSNSMETLASLQALQVNLRTARNVLLAASQWDTTLASVAPLLAQNNLEGAVEAMQGLQQGTQALSSMPGQGERDQAVEDLEAQVLAMLQPQLLEEMQKGRHEKLSDLQSLYQKVGQADQFWKLFQENTQSQVDIRNCWFQFENDLVTWLPEVFLPTVASSLSRDQRLATQVLEPEKVPNMMRQCLESSLEPLQASFKARISNVCSTEHPSLWPQLVLMYQQFEDVLLNLECLNLKTNDESSRTVLRRCLAPFQNYWEQFVELERAYLQASLRTPPVGSQLYDVQVEKWQEIVQETWVALREAWDRSQLMGAHLPAWQSMMQEIVVTWLEAWTKGLQGLSARTDALDETHIQTAFSLLEMVRAWQQEWQNYQASLVVERRSNTWSVEDSPTEISPWRTVLSTITQKLGPAAVNLVLDVCWAVPRERLQNCNGLDTWSAETAVSEDDYGILPQAYISAVGEHLVALVQVLEANCGPSLDTKVPAVCWQPWRELVQSSGVPLSDKLVESLMDGKVLEGFTDAVYEEYDHEDNHAVLNGWLHWVALLVTGRLLERLLRIPALSARGAQQFQADVAYLANVLSALGVNGHPHTLLVHLEQVIDDDNLADRIAQRQSTTHSLETSLRAMEERLAAMRAGRS